MPEIYKKQYLLYKGRPLVRDDQTIVYGDMKEDKYVLILEIFNYKEEKGHQVPSSILIQVVESANTANIVKQGQKQNIYEAFSMGVTWLERALADS